MLGVIHPLVFFPMYEKLKIGFMNNYEDKNAKKLSNKYILASSVISKVTASFCCYPHEVLRARLWHEGQRKPMLQLIRTIIKREGYKGFYSGFAANLCRTIPNWAIILVIYENLCSYFHLDA